MDSGLRVVGGVERDDHEHGDQRGDGHGHGHGHEEENVSAGAGVGVGVEQTPSCSNPNKNNHDERQNFHSQGTDPTGMRKAGRFKCMVCGQTFGRVEHLTRHERSHSREGWVRCEVGGCGKRFYRIDALRRHELVHKKPKRSSLGRGVRACSACAIARRKCSGGNPCEGCEKRSIECKVTHSNRTAIITTTLTGRRESNGFVDEPSSYEMVEMGNNQTGERVTRTRPQPRSQISWSKINSSVNNQGQSNPSSSISQYHPGLGLEHLDATTGQQMNLENFSNGGVHPPFNQFISTSPNNLDPTGNQMSGDTRRDSIISYDHQSTSPSSSMLPLHSMVDLDGQAASQLHIPNTGLSDTLTESPGSWTQYNLSSINWLPYDWVPDYQLEDDGMGVVSDMTDVNASSPIQTHPTHSTTDSTIFTPSPQTQSQMQMDDSPMPTSSSEAAPTTQNTGRYYVDGHGSRLPHIRKAPSKTANSCPPISQPTIDELDGAFAFPADNRDDNSYPNCKKIPQEVYNIILDVFEKTCMENSHFFIPFHSTPFPPLHLLSRFITYYIDSFHQTLPFIHLSSFDMLNSHWLFLLAMAAVGSHYHGNVDYARPMHEFLRRAIISTSIKGDSGCSRMVMIRVKLLSCVGMMYCGCEELLQYARLYHRDLIDFCCCEWKASNKMSRVETTQSSPHETGMATKEWKKWYDAESIRRTGYCIWLLDCMWYFHFQIRPSLSLDDSSVLLPCQEVLWEAASAIEWQQLLSCSSTSPTLHNALQRMYTEKRLQSSMGEFSRILLIHGLFRRTWEVETYLKQPLTHWTPTAEKQNLPRLPTDSPIWLPGIQKYSNWRNSACDCLDILHWHANSVIGAASGMEHPTVLHLHLARVVLLTPLTRIVQFAEHLSSSSLKLTSASSDPRRESDGDDVDVDGDVMEARDCIKRWAREDQHKARLAIIHAGALFWHARRFGVDAFYEAPSVYLATLALWAYGLFAEHRVLRTGGGGGNGKRGDDGRRGRNERREEKGDEEEGDNEEEEEEEEDDDDDAQINECYPTLIQLDRPVDDELGWEGGEEGIGGGDKVVGERLGDCKGVEGEIGEIAESGGEGVEREWVMDNR
ncbi:hypothetical protein DSL72_007642 [Monilinia vaccinii-corymbosi]|uniref:C2H2-type domain-containing protein n=1 Tax=Monilinia vaccinii-corymbosi TaxID=61207 RepID=A0A8A3PIE2_9HELO|nr:hypothetical protein DSL72_007642 [Monilinia vaccinii-corymbosi]